MADCDLVQQLPIDWKAVGSPSMRMTLPSCTTAMTPHSILPQPRQPVRTRLISPLFSWAFSAAAAKPEGTADRAPAAAAVAADSFRKLRRDIFNCVMSLLLLPLPWKEARSPTDRLAPPSLRPL